jgi:hypothetical protein
MTKTPDVPDANGKRDAQKSASDAKPKRKGKDFGLEGTNKTIAVPQPDAQPADELQGTKSKFIPKSPYTRG